MPTQTIIEPYAREVDFLGTRARILTDPDGEASIGAVEMIDIAPGHMPPLHVHHDHDEGFYVLEGEITLYLPDRQVTLAAGDFFLAPRGVPHTFQVGAEGARSLTLSAPSGFERFVRDIAALEQLTPAAMGPIEAALNMQTLGPPGARP
jgi:quercetin dioxygenase-like cupin family protein